MQLFLQFLGGACLAVGILVVGAFLWMRWQLRKMIKLASAMGGSAAPIRVQLISDPDGDWADAERVSERVRQFEALGFRYVGTYRIDLVPDFRMVALVHSDEPAYGTVTENPMTGVFSEVVQLAEDGRNLTITTMKSMGDAPTPPTKTLVRLTKASVGDLFAEVRMRRLSGSLKDHSLQNFVTHFEDAYHAEMRWQYEEGGLRNANAREVENLTGVAIDRETGEYLRTLHPTHWPEEIEDRLREKFLKSTSMSAAEWDQVQDYVAFIHDQMDFDDIVDAVIDAADTDDAFTEDWDRLKGQNPRETYRNILTDMGMMDRVELLACMDDPVPCDVYRLRRA